MASVSSDDDDCGEERRGSYSLSADVSESDSCSSFSCRDYYYNNNLNGCGHFKGEGCSNSLASTPHPAARGGGTEATGPGWSFSFPANVMAPVVGGRDVVFWEVKKEKEKEVDFPGNFMLAMSGIENPLDCRDVYAIYEFLITADVCCHCGE